MLDGIENFPCFLAGGRYDVDFASGVSASEGVFKACCLLSISTVFDGFA